LPDDSGYLRASKNLLVPSVREGLDSIVHAALNITGDMADLQLYDPVSDSLKMSAEHGFNREFLDFFASIHNAKTASWADAL